MNSGWEYSHIHLVMKDPSNTTVVDTSSHGFWSLRENGYNYTLPSNAPTGTYTVNTSLNTGPYQGTVSRTKTFTVISSNDFSISVTPSSQTVNLTSINGFNSPVSLSATSSLPSGVTYSFSPTSVTPTGSSTLTITTSSSTPANTYTIRIQGTGGGKTHTYDVTLIIQSSSSSDLNMNITSPSEGATITTSIFQVSGTFDSAPPTNNFKLVVTVGAESHTYDFTATGTTWAL